MEEFTDSLVAPPTGRDDYYEPMDELCQFFQPVGVTKDKTCHLIIIYTSGTRYLLFNQNKVSELMRQKVTADVIYWTPQQEVSVSTILIIFDTSHHIKYGQWHNRLIPGCG